MTMPDPTIPRPLEEGIRSAYAPFPPGLTPQVDQRMLALAGVIRPTRRRTMLRVGVSAAAAAAIAAGITIWAVAPHARSGSPRIAQAPAAATSPSDLNHDGRVDMLDALALARQVESHSATLDLNNDGRIDTGDADALAADAVRLERGTL